MAGVNHLRNKKEGERREVLDHVSPNTREGSLSPSLYSDHQEDGRWRLNRTCEIPGLDVSFRC